jgi:hypothetical protein
VTLEHIDNCLVFGNFGKVNSSIVLNPQQIGEVHSIGWLPIMSFEDTGHQLMIIALGHRKGVADT